MSGQLQLTSIKMSQNLSKLNQTSCSVEHTVALGNYFIVVRNGTAFLLHTFRRHSLRPAILILIVIVTTCSLLAYLIF